ncbi:hypothetical protein [Streptomyces silvisoli]|uniref:Lipoprotein n=1 Tax=Streptomyces silvisoli TaxID=3034235 RepID=A0ABT5ZPL8_9ACTN|nr:hypothetical protein [Streptomyces silvisoli]MDF3291777.1 hypothetical protein [Streptomyces silvisoli]
MKKTLARGAAVAFMSAAVVLPLSGVAQAMTPTWNHPDHQQRHCRHHHHHHHHHLWNDDWANPWGWRDHRGMFDHH